MSLSEMLAAFTICAFVLTATYTLLEHGLRVHAIGAARVESQEAARAALIRLAREIRVAGVGADEDFPAVAVAEPARIVLVSDLNADGATTARGERITWQLVGSTLRRNAGAGAQPVANGVRALELQYFDADGRPTADLAAIRVVEVALVVAPADASSLARGVSTRVSTRVRLRNR